MEISTKELRIQPGRIISQVVSGQEITITYRGKPRAKIVPIIDKKSFVLKKDENELFGIWKNRNETENVEQFVRGLRKGRKV